MFISYNGVTLELLTIDSAGRDTVFTPDGADVLYTEWDIRCTAVYAPGQAVGPGGTSVNLFGSARDAATGALASTAVNAGPWGASGAPQSDPSPGGMTQPGPEGPVLTDRDLRLRLSVPRRQLLIGGYDTRTGEEILWLRSPRPGLFCDAKNGPFVRAQTVAGIGGGGASMAVGLEIKTWEPPCAEGFDRLVLSHRWQMTHDYDDDYYLTRTVAGEIYLHTGLLKTYGLDRQTDGIARQLFHPIPRGFRRKLGRLSESPDGSVIRYSYSDTDQKIVFAPATSGATQMDLKETVSFVAPGRSDGLRERVAGAAAGVFGGVGQAFRQLPVVGGLAEWAVDRIPVGMIPLPGVDDAGLIDNGPRR